jgi:hypothetical protein
MTRSTPKAPGRSADIDDGGGSRPTIRIASGKIHEAVDAAPAHHAAPDVGEAVAIARASVRSGSLTR